MNERTQKGKGKEKKRKRRKTFYSSPYTLYIPCVAEANYHFLCFILVKVLLFSLIYFSLPSSSGSILLFHFYVFIFVFFKCQGFEK